MNGNKARKLRQLAKFTIKAEPSHSYKGLYSKLKEHYKVELKTVNQK